MSSAGERLVETILQKECISYKTEVSFPNLKGYKGKLLRFDFEIRHPLWGKVYLEWHGEQHYRHIKHFSKTLKDFRYRQQLDVKKCSYCLAYNLPLFIIPFTEYENIKTSADLFQEKFRVRDRNHIFNHNPIK